MLSVYLLLSPEGLQMSLTNGRGLVDRLLVCSSRLCSYIVRKLMEIWVEYTRNFGMDKKLV